MSTYNSTNLPAGTVLNGRRVRIVTPFPALSNEVKSEVTGLTGICTWEKPDSDGDIHVEFDTPIERTGRLSSYVREWEFLDGPESLTSSEPVERTAAERQLDALIDAVYQGAKDNGYERFLADVMNEAGIPLRDANRRLTLRGQRVVSPYNMTEVNDALDRLKIGEVASDTEVSVNRVLAEFVVSVPWPGEHTDCHDLNNALTDDYTQIPDEVLQKAALAVGLRGNVETLRVHLTNQHKISPAYGASVTCTFC